MTLKYFISQIKQNVLFLVNKFLVIKISIDEKVARQKPEKAENSWGEFEDWLKEEKTVAKKD